MINALARPAPDVATLYIDRQAEATALAISKVLAAVRAIRGNDEE
jgi:hypothetical protein